MYNEDYLIHYGVKGMKWGVRNDPEIYNTERILREIPSNAFKVPSTYGSYKVTQAVNKVNSEYEKYMRN